MVCGYVLHNVAITKLIHEQLQQALLIPIITLHNHAY